MKLVPGVPGLCYGGDYNPEQWPEQVWAEDTKLMQEAGVNLATVGVFAWSLLEPEPGVYQLDWLARVLDLLHQSGVGVDLATATAAPPLWFSHRYPESLLVDADGRRRSYGSRQAFCPSSPVYREAALALVEQLATRFHDHPALVMWHVHNEYGGLNARCYCDVAAGAFRTWLQQRYGDLDALNDAWGTLFWSQRFTAWEQVIPPRTTTTAANPTQDLDFRRFCSDALLELFCAERDLLHRRSPGIPVTTNLMVTANFANFDYWRWAPELSGKDRLLATDHYVVMTDPIEDGAQVAFGADVSRSLAGGGRWLLMEHSTSALSWRPHNPAKRPGQMIRNSLSHVARGSEGALFFQWRASRYGAEKWHSAMLPHSGTDSRIWADVVTLGRQLGRLADVSGSVVDADVALLLDYPSGWAAEAPDQPSVDMATYAEIRRWHAVLWRAGVLANVAHPAHNLSRYRLVLAPHLYLLDDAAAANLASYVAAGGTLVVGPYSGIADENDHVRLGGYPGALRELLGIRVSEHFPLLPEESVTLDDGATGTIWTEQARAEGATVVASYAGGPTAGAPAVTRNSVGEGTAWYLGTRLVDADLGRLLAAAGATPLLPDAPAGLEAVRRRHPDGHSYLFLINHAGTDATVAAAGTDLLTGTVHAAPVTVPAGGVVILHLGFPEGGPSE